MDFFKLLFWVWSLLQQEDLIKNKPCIYFFVLLLYINRQGASVLPLSIPLRKIL